MAMKTAVKKVSRKKVAKVIHGPIFKTHIRAGIATPAPPLGPMVGQRGVNVQNFCKEFNKETGHIIPGVPLPSRITVHPDRTFTLEIHSPTPQWLLKQAAGVVRGAEETEIVGKISVKHLYEIAKVKSKDSTLVGVPLRDICEMLITIARTCGIQVVREMDPVEYKAFLEARREVLDRQLKELSETKAAKMLRTSAAATSAA